MIVQAQLGVCQLIIIRVYLEDKCPDWDEYHAVYCQNGNAPNEDGQNRSQHGGNGNDDGRTSNVDGGIGNDDGGNGNEDGAIA